MKEALKEFIKSLPNGENGVRFFEMPTGSGKTYGAINLLHDFILNNEDIGVKRIIYLTNIKSNLNKAYGDLKSTFKEGDSVFDANVLKITANIDCVIDNILKVEADDEITKLSSFQNLKNNVKLLDSLQQLDETTSDVIDNFKKTELGKSEKLFRNDLEKIIFKWNDCPKEAQRIIKIKNKYPWLIKLYPAILTTQRKVLFITTDKFHAGNNPIVNKSYRFASNTIIKDSLIILDESDKAKMHLLNHQIQNATDYQLDLLNTVCAIYKSFATDEKPEDLFKQVNVEEIEKTTSSAFRKTKDVFEDTFNNHNLKYQFKLEDDSDGKNFFIFHDFDPMTISSQKEAKLVYIRKDDKRKLNIITKTERKHTDRLSSLIGDLVGAIKFFITFVSIAADNYMEAKNKDLKVDEQIEFEDAISTVLSVFGIEQNSLETLKRIVINSSRKVMGKKVAKKKSELFGYDLYEEGFQLYSFLNDPSHDLSTKIMMSFLDETPEKFLKMLAGNAKVACVSATSCADTVLNNFNLTYLKDSLGNSMSFMPRKTVERLEKVYKDRREKAGITISVDAIDINDDLFKDFTGQERQQLEAIFNSYPDSKKGKQPLFYKKLVAKTAIAIKKFANNEDGHVMLVITPRLLKQNSSGGIYNKETIESILKIVSKNSSKQVSILTLSSKNYNYFKSEYSKVSGDKDKKVIIFSSYSSAGTGQNLQYTMMDEAGIGREVDIDSIYLEKPTYILSIPEKNMSEAALSELIYENLALATNREKTFRDAKAFINNACKVKEKNEDDTEQIWLDQNYECDSVNNAGITIIKQAIGRISRTDNNHDFSRHKFIYLDQEIFNSFSFEGEINKFNTMEFQEVVKKATAPIRKNLEVDKEMNYALNMCYVSRCKVRGLLQIDKDRWALENADFYKRMRTFVLRHPTASEQDLLLNPDMRMFYLKAPNGEKINTYFFERTNEGDNYQIKKIDYAKFYHGVEASSKYVKLDDFMNVPEVKGFFSLPENNFATFFAKNDYILFPNILDDIYRGALGEAVGHAIFKNKLHIELQEITDLSKFEKFDYCLLDNPDVYVDFKHWSRARKDDEEELEKVAEKKRKIGAKAVIVINVLGSDFSKNVYYYKKDSSIVVVPWLLMNTYFGPTIDEKRCTRVKMDIEEVLR